MNRLQFLSGSGLANMKKQFLSSFVAGRGYFSFMSFHVFFDKLSSKLLWLFLVCLFFPDEIAFSSILRIKMIFFAPNSILRENKT